MANAKHTPGLLVVKDTDDGIVYRVITKESAVVMAEAQSEHFAHLIAAAPDLLEACQTFAEWLRREEAGFVKAGNKRDTPEGERKWREWYEENLRLCSLAQEQARAAIAKAEGE